MNLYEIDARLANLLDVDDDIVDGETGEIVSLEEVEALEMERAAKIEGWGLWIKNRRAEIDAIKAEEKNLKERREHIERITASSMERYRQYLAGEKVSTPRLSVSYHKSEAVEIDDDAIIPEEYERKKIIVDPDKVALKAAIKSGQQIDGVRLVQRQSMTIK